MIVTVATERRSDTARPYTQQAPRARRRRAPQAQRGLASRAQPSRGAVCHGSRRCTSAAPPSRDRRLLGLASRSAPRPSQRRASVARASSRLILTKQGNVTPRMRLPGSRVLLAREGNHERPCTSASEEGVGAEGSASQPAIRASDRRSSEASSWPNCDKRDTGIESESGGEPGSKPQWFRALRYSQMLWNHVKLQPYCNHGVVPRSGAQRRLCFTPWNADASAGARQRRSSPWERLSSPRAPRRSPQARVREGRR